MPPVFFCLGFLRMLTLIFDGVAYGMLLFVLAVGLAVTLGLMNFINLAHGAFAMAGGYITVLLMSRLGVPFLWCLPISFVLTAAAGALFERTLYRPMYGKPHLDQVLFSIGLVFMAMAAVDYFVGSQQQIIQLPEWLQGRFDLEGVGIGKYRLFIILVCAALTVLLQWVLTRTRFGSRLRAAVGDARVASGLGLNVNRIFLLTFAVGSGLAGLGGAVGGRGPGGQRPGPERQPHLPADLRGRLGPGRPGRGDGRGGAGPGPELPAQVHGLFPDCRVGWRPDPQDRPAAG